MKKISVVLVILMIFNFICQCFRPINIYAETEPTTTIDTTASDTGGDVFTIEDYKSIADEGKAEVNGTTKEIKLNTSDTGASINMLGTVLVNIGLAAMTLMKGITSAGGYYYTDSVYSANETGLFTINSLIFGEYIIFNTKAYQKSTDLNNAVAPTFATETVDKLKEMGSAIGGFISKLGMALSLPLILYAIMKTVNARKASDLAAWKKILVRWALCFFLLFFFQYILATIDTAGDYLTGTLWDIRVAMEENGHKAFEITVLEDTMRQYEHSGGITSFAYGILVFGIVVLQILFLVKYAMRALAIIFLFIIAPIVIIMHSVRLMLGKDSTMLGDFFKDYTLLILMQPLHAIIYIIFFFTLSEIAINVPALGIMLLFALFRANDIAKAMFGWELGASLFSRK